ncbi:MAG: hypothetical protein CMH48_08745 [Muricauda sp.]|nr:hypothetical protein [Allomuricauda sp.]MAU26129.1 hypothetical protein [Allomuricauda sp.]MBC30921.1 hypothetical protein [Allomuricauda sp.]|tara:strand:+ start:242 stop:1150 length:909 start_codon:yes stop_codon:yes gene_type:complete
MVKNYLVLFVGFCSMVGMAQSPRLFKVEDFDLKGPVKTCEVVTDYGKEIFEFNDEGILVKSTTQYNEQDQDITYYMIENGHLSEKRMESFKDNVLDKATSMANFYEVDTTQNKVVSEKIVSYDKNFVEHQEYRYDESGRLVGIISSHLDGVDETNITYEVYQNERTESHFLNGVLEKTIRVSENEQGKTILTKEFVDGNPDTATEQKYDATGKLVSEELFDYDEANKRFKSREKHIFGYDAEGVLTEETIIRGAARSKKEYIFQFDSHKPKNWVKKIVLPDNDYTTRKIEYYLVAEEAEKPE